MPIDEKYINHLSKMRRPIPGSSLTNDPDNPLPFEKPPEFVKKKDALEAIFVHATDPEIYPDLMEALATGHTIEDLTKLILMQGFREGKWNPDLFLLLIEPVMYMLMGLCERVGIKYEINNDVDEDEIATTNLDQQLNKVKETLGTSLPAGVLPREIEQKIKELPVDSLLNRPMEEAVNEEGNETSLLAPMPEEE